MVRKHLKLLYEILVNDDKSCMTCFVLKKTLDDADSVTRGIFKMNGDNNLTEIIEIKNIIKR